MSRTRRRDRARVSTVTLARRSRPVDTRAWSRNERSKRMLWPTRTAPPTNSRKDGSISPLRGASTTISSLMPVSAVMNGAIRSSAPVPGGSDLGEGRRGRRAPGGLDVEDHEGDLAERGAQVVEGSLQGDLHGDTVANMCLPAREGRWRGGYRRGGDHRLIDCADCADCAAHDCADCAAHGRYPLPLCRLREHHAPVSYTHLT